MKPAIGACTESAIFAFRASSPKRTAQGYAIQNPAAKSISQAVNPRCCSSLIASDGLLRDGTRAGPKRSFAMELG